LTLQYQAVRRKIMQDVEKKKFAQSKIDFLGTKADSYILFIHHKFRKRYQAGKINETPHKKDVAALLVELGYEFLRAHEFNVDKARAAIK
jgi:hypothetical protein